MSNTELTLAVEDSPQLNHMKISRLDDSLFSKELAPHYMNLSKQLASSELVPKSFRGKPQDLFICWAMGYQVGLSPEQSMQCIAVINGKPAMWGDDMLALCMAHKDFDDIIEEPICDVSNSVIGYRCTVKRKGKAPKVNEFDLNMAKKAGLLAKGGVWTQYTERMLKLRARGFSLRDAFPDALKGIKPREEVEDYVDVEYKVVEGSRAEFLKKELLTKKEDDVSNKETDNEVQDLESQSYTEESIDRRQHPEMVSDGDQKAKSLNSDSESSIVAPEKCKQIMQLMRDKSLSTERIEKALKYYQVDSIGALTNAQADNFITKLNKN